MKANCKNFKATEKMKSWNQINKIAVIILQKNIIMEKLSSISTLLY